MAQSPQSADLAARWQTLIELKNGLQYKIDNMRENDDQRSANAITYSRACSGCGKEEACERFVATACGHAVCRGCASDADDGTTITDHCPNCRTPSDFNKLIEDAGSRECGICYTPCPTWRAVLSACGHTLCTACAFQMSADAVCDGLRPLRCPYCRAETDFCRMKEEPVLEFSTELVEPLQQLSHIRRNKRIRSAYVLRRRGGWKMIRRHLRR